MDIILSIYLTLLDFDMRFFLYQFSLKNVNNNSILEQSQFKIYDIDVMFLSYEGEASIVIVVKDISERLILDSLEMQSHGIDMVLSSITHDMRAPLHAILGYAENLAYKVSQLEPEQSGILSKTKKISANCEHLTTLVNDILDSTRIANNNFNLNIVEFDLPTLIKECIEIAKTIQDSKQVVFGYKGPLVLKVTNDSHRLKRVLLNLLANSIKFTEKGSIKIEAIEKAEIILLKVIDTGKGIEKNIQKNLFNPFVSYNSSGSTEGIGLGLSTTRKLVERLGPTGKITIQSEIKKGSIFSFQVYKQI